MGREAAGAVCAGAAANVAGATTPAVIAQTKKDRYDRKVAAHRKAPEAGVAEP